MGISSSNQQFNDPSFLTNFLQQNIDDQKTVTTGPGGSTGAPVVTIGDMITRFVGPSNQGMTGSSKDFDINAAAPSLSFPTTMPFTLSQSTLTNLVNQFTSGSTGDKSLDDLFGFDAGGGDKKDTRLTMQAPADLVSPQKDKVFSALMGFTGVDQDPGLTDSQRLAFKEKLMAMAGIIAEKNASGGIPELASGDPKEISAYLQSILTTNGMEDSDVAQLTSTLDVASAKIAANEFTTGLQSTEKDAVLTALKSFISFDPKLDDAAKTALNGKLEELAKNIANQNATGKPDPALSTFDDAALKTYLLSKVDVSTLSPANKTAFTDAVTEGATELGSINAASGMPPAKSSMMQGMESTDQAAVLATLKSMVTPDQASALSDDLTALATTIAAKNASPGGSGLDITDADSLKTALVAMLSPAQATNAKLLEAIGVIATTFAAENTAFFTTLSKSTDPAVVFDALRHLSNIDHNPALSPQDRQAGLNYLKLMAQALAFMSTIRAKISMLEAQLRKQENEGKLATIKDQSKAAQDSFTTGISKIEKDIQKALDALAMKALMKILGPIVILILAIITAILSIVGCSAVGAAIMIAVIVVMTVIAIADMQTGMFDKLGQLCSKDPAGQKAASFGFQAIIMAIMIVFSFGACAGFCAAQIASKMAAEGMKIALKTALSEAINIMKDQLGKETVKKLVQFVIGEVISLLMSSGLLTEGFTKMFKAMGMSDKDAEMASMILTIIIMLVMMGAMIKAAGGSAGKMGASAGGAAVKGATDAVAKEVDLMLEQTTKQGIKKAVSFADEAIEVGADGGLTAVKVAVDDSADEMLKTVVDNLKKKLAEMSELTKDPAAFLQLMQGLELLTKVGSSVGQAVQNFNQANLTKAQAILTESNSATQALIDELKQLMPSFEMTQQDLDNDSKDFFKGYTELSNLFANFIQDASKITTDAVHTS